MFNNTQSPQPSTQQYSTQNKLKRPWSSASQEDFALKPEGVIRFEIRHIGSPCSSPFRIATQPHFVGSHTPVAHQCHSESIFIRGLPWRMKVTFGRRSATDADEVLSCYVMWNSERGTAAHNQACLVASAKIRLVAQTMGKPDILKVLGKRQLYSNDNTWGCELESFKKILDPANGWYDKENDSIILEVEISAGLPQNVKHLTCTSQEAERLNESEVFKRLEQSETLKNRMKHLLASGYSADAHFLVGDKKEPLAAHRAILASASDVFEKIYKFKNEQGRDPNVPLGVPDVDAHAFRIMLNYIYTEELEEELDGCTLFDVLTAAKKYNVFGLLQACIDRMDHIQLDNNNVLIVLGQARQFGKKSLADRCWAFIDQNIYEVILSEKFLKIEKKLLEEILGRDTLNLSRLPIGEIAIWNAALRWAADECGRLGMKCAGADRRWVLGSALYKIRVPLIGQTDLAEKIVPTGVLTQKEVASVHMYQQNPATFSNSIQTLKLDQYQMKFPTGQRA